MAFNRDLPSNDLAYNLKYCSYEKPKLEDCESEFSQIMRLGALFGDFKVKLNRNSHPLIINNFEIVFGSKASNPNSGMQSQYYGFLLRR
ncbi:hypothetical protein HWI79_2921 [Cryptosporidium felis]|nr:hypothetical protein HWI79_2921 [Cryptosporidium felis]